MKNTFILFMLFTGILSAQDKIITSKAESEQVENTIKTSITTKRSDSLGVKRFTNWEKFNKIALDFSQMTFVRWNAGGSNSVAGLVAINLNRNYNVDYMNWKNEFVFRYGINNQEGQATRKTDDIIQLNSNYGYRTAEVSNWFYSSKFTFTTQATDGFAYPNTTKIISTFMAPAYLMLGVGAEYAVKEKNFSVYISPITQKTTFVLSQSLADIGAYGVEKAVYDDLGNKIQDGKKSRTEMGFFVKGYLKNEILKNIIMENRLGLYSDYLNNFGNIDLDWQLKLDLIVNKYVRANILLHMVYDDDIKARDEVNGVQQVVGPRLQLKQILGIGVTYEFK